MEAALNNTNITGFDKILGNGVYDNGILTDINYITEDGVATKDVLNFANNVLSNLFQIRTPFLHDVLKVVKENTLDVGELNGNQIEHVVDELRKGVLSGSPTLFGIVDPKAERARLLLDTKDNKSLGTRIEEYLDKSSNTFLKNTFAIERGKKASDPVRVLYDNVIRNNNSNDIDLINGLTELLTSKDNELRSIGEDLVKYTYYTNGAFSPVSFINIINAEYLKQIGFDKALRNINLDNPYRYTKQYFQHNPYKAKNLVSYIDDVKVQYNKINEGNRIVKFKLSSKRELPKFTSMYDKKSHIWKLYEAVADNSTSDTNIITYLQIFMLYNCNSR